VSINSIAPPTEDRGRITHKTVISLFPGVRRQTGTKHNVYSWRRKAVVDRSSFSRVGSVFHAHDATTEKAQSPIRLQNIAL